MKCPNKGCDGDVHPINEGGGSYAKGEYVCGECLTEFYGDNMRDAIKHYKRWGW